jgi:S-adenosylmethionine-dependent methyltransferase
MRARHVHAFDLAPDQVAIAGERCQLLGLPNVSLFSRDVDWVQEYSISPLSLAPSPDLIVAYALLEHLTPEERLRFLIGAWRHLPMGGHLVVIETPNRLYWFDWHSSQMPFADQVPHEIAFLWNEFSPRASIPQAIKANSLESAMRGNVERWYRFGRGASFHEFHIALGTENYEVIDAPIIKDRPTFAGYSEPDIEALRRQTRAVRPPVHDAFALPCLDLVLKKTGEPRLTL